MASFFHNTIKKKRCKTKRLDRYERSSEAKLISPIHTNVRKAMPFCDLHRTYNETEYSEQWTLSLKALIRKRDNYTCQICHKKLDATNTDVHHIDYDKMNCLESNLVTLCKNCHKKTNRNRQLWYKMFWERLNH